MEEDNKNKSDRDIDGREQSILEEIERLRREKEDAARMFNEAMKSRVEEAVKAAQAQVEAIAKNSALRKSQFSARLRPILFLLGLLLSVTSSVVLVRPDILQTLSQNYVATALGLSGVSILMGVFFMGLLSATRAKTFIDIDDRLYSARVEAVEAERDELISRVNDLEFELGNNVSSSSSVASRAPEFVEVDMPKFELNALLGAADSKSFDVYMKSLIRSLDMNIEIADNKASLLLDKGTTYLWRGILFYVVSIVVWQVVTAYFKVGEFAVWGMISCSMTFLVVEFLAAWFLRQYKSFTDSSFNLVRVKSIFNRYFLSYLAIKEFSDSAQHLVDMRAQMLKVLEGDIKWLEPVAQKPGELNHMIAMFESVSGLVEKLKVGKKVDSSTASS